MSVYKVETKDKVIHLAHLYDVENFVPVWTLLDAIQSLHDLGMEQIKEPFPHGKWDVARSDPPWIHYLVEAESMSEACALVEKLLR